MYPPTASDGTPTISQGLSWCRVSSARLKAPPPPPTLLLTLYSTRVCCGSCAPKTLRYLYSVDSSKQASCGVYSSHPYPLFSQKNVCCFSCFPRNLEPTAVCEPRRRRLRAIPPSHCSPSLALGSFALAARKGRELWHRGNRQPGLGRWRLRRAARADRPAAVPLPLRFQRQDSRGDGTALAFHCGRYEWRQRRRFLESREGGECACLLPLWCYSIDVPFEFRKKIS